MSFPSPPVAASLLRVVLAEQVTVRGNIPAARMVAHVPRPWQGQRLAQVLPLELGGFPGPQSPHLKITMTLIPSPHGAREQGAPRSGRFS